MRKQYHFRKIDNKLYAWDVDNLIFLTKELEIENIDLSKINEFEETYWYNEEGDSPTCRSITQHIKLVNDSDLNYPIIVCPDGKLMDGMHRVVKANLLELKTIKAYRLSTLPKPDYIDVNPDDLPYDEN
ncbi:hypothetical protein ACTS9T_10380 [Empedobacter falsenii]|uniref:hypothetical protein n=1 Tax=Empedobacter TaxID=59734 RepID=UPI002446C145|nr:MULTISPECIES: hypothetical protein [Empedobacter]MDH1881693.1 hypothetical protein [Empedobacter sp. GD03797]MDM1041447.1 hypothetical protein [Empedobacter brevis]MDM1135026.1 hypothetical protein [Empedobacter sp. R750]